MKTYTSLIFALFSCFAFSQLEVGADHYGRKEPIKPEVLEKFKASTTLFVFPDWFSTEEYEEILEQVWTVNSFEILEFDDFDLNELYGENYSFVTLDFERKNRKNKMGNSISGLYTFLDLSLYNAEETSKRLAKFDDRVKSKKLPLILEANRNSLAKFYMYPDEMFIKKAVGRDRISMIEGLYMRDIFYNNSIGMLKNYLQKLNTIILAGDTYHMEKKDYAAEELRTLASSTLFIPEYVKLKPNLVTGKTTEMKDKEFNKLFELYAHSYELISEEELSKAITTNKELLYLRYVRVGTEKFIQVVNSLTGDVIYRDYVAEPLHLLKPDKFEYLSGIIDEINRGEAK
jgi:hypothetical protein